MQTIRKFVEQYLNPQTKALTFSFGEFDTSFLENADKVYNFLMLLSQWEFGVVLDVETNPNEVYAAIILYSHLKKYDFMIDSVNSAERVNVIRETRCRDMIEVLASELNLNLDFSKIYISQ